MGNSESMAKSSHSRNLLVERKEDSPSCHNSDSVAEDLLSALPVGVLEDVLLNLEKSELLKCRLLSQLLCDIISKVTFWRKKLQQTQQLSSSATRSLIAVTCQWKWHKYALFCGKKPFTRNFIQNGSAELMEEHENLAHGKSGRNKLKSIPHWTIVENGGDGWQVERPPYGAAPLPSGVEQSASSAARSGGAIRTGGCYTTSYGQCRKMQLIDLNKELAACVDIMDTLRPDIVVSNWVAGRHDASSSYSLRVELLDAAQTVVASGSEQRELGQGNTGMEWVKVERVLSGYGPSVRYVRVTHGGKDSCFWAGWYGPKITGSVLRLRMPSTE